MTTTAGTTTHNLELAADIVEQCWDPPRPDRFARFTSSERAQYLFAAAATAFPDARLQVSWMVADERRVVIGGRIVGTHNGPWRDIAATGRPVDIACTVSLAIDDGVVLDTSTITDSLALAEQIGAVVPLGPKACQVFEQAGGAR